MTATIGAISAQGASDFEPISEAEFDGLYRRRVRLVLRYLRRSGVSSGWEDDCAHEVFMTAAKKWRVRDPSISESAWLCAIARRVASNHRRRTDRAARNEANAEPRPAGVSPHRRVEVHEDLAFVERFIESLPEKYREIFVLCEIDNCSCVDVAEVLDLPVNTVYTRLARARKRLNGAVETRERRNER